MFNKGKDALQRALACYEKLNHYGGIAYCHTLLFYIKKKLGIPVI